MSMPLRYPPPFLSTQNLNPGLVVSGSNQCLQSVTANWRHTCFTEGCNSNQRIWVEMKIIASPARHIMFGIIESNSQRKDQYPGQFNVEGESGYSIFIYNGHMYHNGVGVPYGAAVNVGDVVGMDLDVAMGTVTFYKNKEPLGVGIPIPRTKTWLPAVSLYSIGDSVQVGNFNV